MTVALIAFVVIMLLVIIMYNVKSVSDRHKPDAASRNKSDTASRDQMELTQAPTENNPLPDRPVLEPKMRKPIEVSDHQYRDALRGFHSGQSVTEEKLKPSNDDLKYREALRSMKNRQNKG